MIHKSKDALKKAGLHKPLLKLVSSRYRRRAALAERLIADIHQRGFEKLCYKHARADPSCGKYLDVRHNLTEMVGEADKLGLLDSPPIRALDIGCGAGYFLFTLKSAGHDVLGLDLPDTPLYTDVVKMLGVRRIEHRVVKQQPLPDLGKPFDLISAFSIVFDLHRTPEIWGPDDWLFFVQDCRRRLRPGGRIFLNFNPGIRTDYRFISDEIAQALRSLPGAKLTASKEYFTWCPPK